MRPHFAEFLSTFVDVVRAGSFSGAARRRAMTPSAIVRQIDTLELDLGVALLVRSTRALTLTDAGRRLHERALQLLDDLADTHAEVSAFDGSVSGTLRIACFPTFGKRYVLPVLGTLQAEHPSLKVELDLTERLADPVLERLDVVVRMGQLSDSTLIATKLAPLTRLLVASPAYLAQAGVPGGTVDLASHRLLDKLHGADLLGWREVLGCPAGHAGNGRVVFRSDDFEALRAAAVAGMGIAFLSSWVVGPDVRSGTLIRLSANGEPWNEQPGGIYLLRALPQPIAKVRAFTEALRASIGSPPIWEA
ncbi:LysR family transcriptional regulator [Beijerinckia indica]|uniref:Transcriptional regulator, LysR family n=1 Tax=Beijerinckia indica subsp. indica (strain ATCC 9039 / DSM 1715 / NCIMB 8712) TaxID=395963 RepID=B2IKN7_BEII9|nr:LysR family transcriptional regulator [Beijerinckia indica]ACB95076.1 transcriptional regulator, LysR family [Beijerinckia indica subsp. indica ATCC 9039]